MSKFSRRQFLTITGNSTAALSLGLALPARTLLAAAGPGAGGKYQIFERGKWLPWEKEIIEKRFAEVAGGPVAANDDSSGMMAGFANAGRDVAEKHDILAYNNKWAANNPLFTDEQYAQKAGLPGVPAFPNFKTPRGQGGNRLPKDISTPWYYANDGSDVEFFAPIYPGDTFTSKTDKIFFEELTVDGSDLRHFYMGNTASLYNQRNELVARKSGGVRNAYRHIIDGSPEPSFSSVMEEWIPHLPEAHYTTDEEWEYIVELWEKEQVRGSDKLYWEDVNVGDEPTWVCSGPVSYMDIGNWHGVNTGSKLGMLKNKNVEYRDRFGNYLFNTAMHYGGRNVPGARMVFYNNTAGNFMTRMLTNYIGDSGFVTRTHWHIRQLFPEMQDERFQGGVYLDRVPYMKGKTCTVHGSEGDTIIAKGFVTDKYRNDRGEPIIDVTCWAETLDNRIISVMGASAKLASRSG